jgi:hypothetical protein
VSRAINGHMAPQAECSSDGGLNCAIEEQVVEHSEREGKVDIADPAPNSVEAGAWYYVVDCATCKAAIPFKHAPEGEPILRLPTMRVRCFQCSTVHTYASDLISHREAVAPRGIFRRDQPAKTPDNAQEVSQDRQEARSVGESEGREIVECKSDNDSSSLRRDSIVIAAISGKRPTIFFLSSSFFTIGWGLQLALNIFYPVPIAALAEVHSYGPAVLLDGAHFGAILCGLALFIFGTGSFLVDTCGFKGSVLGKNVLPLVMGNAFMQSFLRWIKSLARTTSFTSLPRQGRRALSPIVSGAATFRSRIKRSAKLRLRQYQ